MGFQQISNLSLFGGWDSFIQNLGIQYHYDSISRGVVDSRDLVYFGSLISFFLGLTYIVLDSRKW